jgi:hypothetical protein
VQEEREKEQKEQEINNGKRSRSCSRKSRR